MKIAVTGSSGLIGSALGQALHADGHEVLRLVRRTPRTLEEHRWEPAHGRIPPGLLDDVDAVVNLAGVGVADRPWTAKRKEQVLASRVDSTTTVSRALAQAVADHPGRERVLLSASAVGWYGDTGDRVVDETVPAGDDFLSRVCVEWEAATGPAVAAGVRVATLRTGLVLARGGLLGRLLPLFRLGLGGKLGNGQQYMPWISLRDEVDAIRFLLQAPVSGPVNLTGPEPVRNAVFTETLAEAVHRPAFLTVPAPAMRLALGELARVAVLSGQRAVPAALQAAGFRHTDTDLASALRAALDRR
jgi:uncharacterized protein (TIGR01777 family)